MSEEQTPTLEEEVTGSDELLDEQDALDVEDTEENDVSQEADGGESDGESTQEQQIALDDIAAVIGLDPEDLDLNEDSQVVLKTKVDGQESTVTFKDSKNSYQIQSNLDKKGMEANQLKEQLKTQIDEQNRQFQQKLQTLEDVSSIALSELQDEVESIDWNELKQDDPGEYAARRQDFQDRQARIHQRLQAVQEERAQIQQSQYQEYIANAEKALVEAFPEWVDTEKGQKEMGELRDYAVKQGFHVKQAQQFADAPLFVILKKARQFDALQQGKPEVKKLVKKSLKVKKPSGKAPDKLLSAEDLFYGT
jgi:hypothetical protein